jgi:pimeloyl-ACP methyl ester carboxylesterase
MSPHGAALFVHGNPETSAVWGPLLGELGRDDVVCLSPPGFGAPLPRGFEPTMTAYRDWLIARLEAFRQPVDLVGHDWGGGHVFNVAMPRPDLIHSWVSDALGLFDPGYEWHPLARGQAWRSRRPTTTPSAPSRAGAASPVWLAPRWRYSRVPGTGG